VENPKNSERTGFRLSDSRAMAHFIKYAGIRSYKVVDFNKMLELGELFETGMHNGLILSWRENGCGQKLATVHGNPHAKRGKATGLQNFLRMFVG